MRPGSGYTVLLPYCCHRGICAARACVRRLTPDVKFTRERASASLRLTASGFFFASSCRSASVSEDDLSENRYLLFGLMVDRGRMSGASRCLAAPTTCRAPSPTQNPLQSDAFELKPVRCLEMI